MNVLLVSQCSERALVATRRVLDHFAERKGARTWQTAITQQGLNTLRKMLRKSARRNTAVACHWIKSSNRTELLWIIGSADKFNEQGSIPTNTTSRDILRTKDENSWHIIENVSLMAGIAGLFHDFGKANDLFQKKLKPGKSKLKSYEPYRHEWISLRFFEAFVRGLSDQEWLSKLLNVTNSDEDKCLASITKDGQAKVVSPFKDLPPFATAVGWLILAHHRLPQWLKTKDGDGAPRISEIAGWLTGRAFHPSWNSPQCINKDWSSSELLAAWSLKTGTPFRSKVWVAKAVALAKRALRRPDLVAGDQCWMSDPLSLHLSRLFLMLSDHTYSGMAANATWQDAKYKAFANTDRITGKLKQKLDEHVVGVSQNAYLMAKGLPNLRQSLPAITRHKGFKKRTVSPAFRWQNKAYELACSIKERTAEFGFFGVNMASTGCGKTFANGRIMYGLAEEKLGCRFSIALGLRTLTLQTGDALQKRLRLEDDDLAVLIGSQAVRDLHYIKDDDSSGFMASESEENLFSDTEHVRYEGTIYDGYLNRWLERSPKLQKLVSAPILVSTIDYLMPATESSRGGKQIAPMLRLLTSDLVLDEPDDFGLDDMYALTRLVHWAGLLGSRVLISSATLPPSLVKGLFDAYLAGRKVFQMGCGVPGRPLSVCCAWFDENGVDQCDCSALETFSERHSGFVSKRVKKLKTAQPLRKARIVPVDSTSRSAEDVVDAFQKAVHKGILELHSKHAVSYPQIDKNISIGLVRMANINPMVAVAQRLFEIESPDNYHIHYCVYHSQFPLAVRSTIEKQLDSALTRHPLDSLLDISSIRNVLMKYPEQNHIFVVVATPVAEVGRDHDYDWAIAEPSSMRSIIQLAGRVQRHRCKEPATENMLILSHNFKGLRMDSFDGAVFNKPGFESGGFKLKSHSLNDLLEATQVDVIDAIPRIQERVPLKEDENLADLEHTHIAAMIYGLDRIPVHASLWWKHDAHWSYELQRRKPFRLSCPDEEYVLLSEDGDEPLLNLVDKDGNFNLSEKCFKRVAVTFSKGVSMWGPIDVLQIFNDLAEQFDEDVGNVSQKFGVMRLRKTEELWNYNSNLGVFKGLT